MANIPRLRVVSRHPTLRRALLLKYDVCVCVAVNVQQLLDVRCVSHLELCHNFVSLVLLLLVVG